MALTEITHDGMDLHIHSHPCIFPRRLTNWQMIEEAKQRGLGGIVITSHESSTADRAEVRQMAKRDLSIKKIGASQCVLVTDFGISESEITHMYIENPRYLVKDNGQ